MVKQNQLQLRGEAVVMAVVGILMVDPEQCRGIGLTRRRHSMYTREYPLKEQWQVGLTWIPG